MVKYRVVKSPDGWFRIQADGSQKPLSGKFTSENAAKAGIRRLKEAQRKQQED